MSLSTRSGVLDDDRITEYGLMVEANRRVARVIEASLRASHGLTLVDFEAMVRLGRSPDNQMSMSVLAGQMVLTSGGVTRLVDRLAAQGHVERVSCPSDRRVQWARLTEHGLQTVSTAMTTHLQDLDECYFSVMSDADRSILAGVLDRLRSTRREASAG